jgi:hypothetical protein
MLSMLGTLTVLMVKASISPVASCSRVQCTAPSVRPFPHHVVLMFAANQSGPRLTLYSRWWLMCSSISSRQPTILRSPITTVAALGRPGSSSFDYIVNEALFRPLHFA